MPFILPPLIILILILIWFTIKDIKIQKRFKVLFFPLMSEKYDFLKKKRWHKLLKVLCFFFILILIVQWFWVINQNRQHSRMVAYQSHRNKTGKSLELVNETYATYISDWVYSTLIVLILNYILQLIYLKLVIYIIYWNKLSKISKK